MTEQEWLACTDPKPMLEFLRDTASDRKFRLFAVVCCRRIWHTLTDFEKDFIDIADRFADSSAHQADLEERYRLINEPAYMLNALPYPQSYIRSQAIYSVGYAASPQLDARSAAAHAAIVGSSLATVDFPRSPEREEEFKAKWWAANRQEIGAQCDLFSDIFGNPFRPVSADPAWLTSTVVALAEGIYQDRAFDRLPILADALQDAGCDNAEVFDHCRGPGPHVRGCWLVDLLTGRK